MIVSVMVEGEVADLLDHLRLDPRCYWVARNRRMLRRSEHSSGLQAGDEIEIWRIMSGGSGPG